MTDRFAIKRLVPVEIDPERSHQHEFHAGRLRTGLGFGDDLVRGRIRLLIYREEQVEPAVVEDGFTLYNARQQNPRRSEWHLYYQSRAFGELARPGDLLVLYRPSSGTDLHGVVVAPDTSRAERLLDALMLRNDAVLREFRLVDEPDSTSAPRELAMALSLPLEGEGQQPAIRYPVSDHPLVRKAIAEERVPVTRKLAEAAGELVPTDTARVDPDGFLIEALDTETRLYFAIESAVNQGKLNDLQRRAAPVGAYLEWAMAVHQGRKARRGQSLQLHFETILKAASVPYTAQCTTERAEVPDFVVPGCSQYHDPAYPSDLLRIVACKSTSKERWRQILNEAERVPEKYLLTLDEGLSRSTIEQMLGARLLPFLPKRLLELRYVDPVERDMVGSVADLVRRLRAATGLDG